MDVLIIINRLLLIFILSFIFGFERQRSNKPVGFGTFIFVALGSGAMAISASIISPDNFIVAIGAIVTGIGFLGAGALIKDHDKTFGFTTAASIWLFAIIGISIGLGNYLLGIILYSFIWIVVLFDKTFEMKGLGNYRSRIIIESNKIVSETEVWEFFRNVGIKKTKLINFKISKKEKKCSLTYFIEGETKKIKNIPKEAANYKWIESFSIE